MRLKNKNILYFNSPTDIKADQNIDFNKKLRVGGMVKKMLMGLTTSYNHLG